MYRVTLRRTWDGAETTIHSPHANPVKLVNATVTQDVAAIDTMTFDIYPGNPGYNAMQYMASLIRVTDTINNMDVFEGRVLSPSEPIEAGGMTYKTITCEDLLAWLHDSRPGFFEFDGKTHKDILTALINAHNAQMTALGAPYKCFKLGTVDMATTKAAYCYTDDTATTYDNISTLVLSAGYELAVRHEKDGLYLDCAKSIGDTGDQVIRLGSNLISFTRSIDPTALASAFMPLGKAADAPSTDTTTDKGAARLTIASANSKSPLLRNDDLIKEFGPIVGTNSWDDETDPKRLMTEGTAYFKAMPVATISTQVQAIDLTFVGKAKGPLLCGWTYRTLIPFKGIDESLRIKQMTLDINDPRNNTLTIGDRVVGQEAYNAELMRQIRGLALIPAMVRQQGAQLAAISQAAQKASKTAEEANTAATALQTDLGNYDFAAMQKDLTALLAKVNALPDNIGDIGAEVLAVQKAQTTSTGATLETLEQRIKALEGAGTTSTPPATDTGGTN